MGQDNLTPTVVTDKNGRVTTVHKRAFKTRSTTLSLPSSQIVDKDRKLADRVVAALDSHYGRQDDLRIRVLIRKLGEHAESFVELVEKAYRDAAEERHYGSENLVYLQMAVHDVNFLDAQRIAKYADLMPDTMSINDMRFVLNVLEGRYTGDKDTPEYLEQVRAHLYAANVYERPSNDHGELYEYENNRALFDMVSRRPNEVDEIMRVNNTYKVLAMSDEVMEECLRTHPAVGQGLL